MVFELNISIPILSIKITKDDIAQQLKIVIDLIYFSEAKHCAAKETIQVDLIKY